MKVRGGELRKNICIEAGKWSHVEVACREGSTISISGTGEDSDDFSVYLLRSADVKRVPVIGKVYEYETGRALWKKEKVKKASKTHTVDQRDVYYVIFDNYHAKTREKYVDIIVTVEHLPLAVGDAPLQESFEVDAKYVETIDVDTKQGDVLNVFGKVTKGKDITVHILGKIYQTPDTLHLDKAYYTREKQEDINIEYHCPKSEPLLLVFDNKYSMRTTKTVDVSVQVVRDTTAEQAGDWVICPYCQIKNPPGSTTCQSCKAGL